MIIVQKIFVCLKVKKNTLRITKKTMNKIKKGNYFRTKTKHFYEADGYEVVTSEIRKPMPIKGRLVWIATDIFASDLIAMNGKEILFIQVKTNRGDVSKAVAEFAKHKFPKVSAKLYAVGPRVRLFPIFFRRKK